MIVTRLFQVLACLTTAVALSACGMFDSKPARNVAATGPQEFDPYSNSWRTSGRIVTPPPSEPNAALAEQQASTKREDSALNKASRAVGTTASAMGRAVKKPLDWLPFGKKDGDTQDEAGAALE